MASGNGIQGWVYVPSELASHVPSEFFVRLKNFEFSPMNRLVSRRGLEPVQYFITASSSLSLVSPTFTASSSVDYFLNKISTETLALFGDSLVVTGPNASSFHIIPFSITASGSSKHYEYIAKDINGVVVPGDERGGFHIYNGKPTFWNGRGTYQKFANTISESGFTDLGNNILPLEDQTIIGACTFENRLVVVSLQGYMMWSQPDWDGESIWQDSEGNATNYLQLTTNPGEIVEFIQAFRGGLIVSTRTSSNVSGRILNIPSLNPTDLQVIDTGVDSFFGRNSVITSTDQLVGISPQGVINVSYDSLARTAKAEFSQSAPIIEYLNEVFADNTIYAYLDAHLDAKYRKGYFVHDWSTDGSRESKILVYDYNSDKWSLFTSNIPVQKVFQMYDHLCAAGWKYINGRLALCIWSFSDYYDDIDFTISENEGNYFIGEETDIQFEKSFIQGVFNIGANDANQVPGRTQYPKQVILSTSDPATYKLGFRKYSNDSWSGSISEYKPIVMGDCSDIEKFSISNILPAKGQWDITKKLHEFYSRFVATLPNPNFSYQLVFSSTDSTRFNIHSIIRDNLRKL
jgi:hypothetical protein